MKMYKLTVVCFALFASLAVGADENSENSEVRQRIFRTYLQQAEQGDVNAQFIVASFYENGGWAVKDPNLAFSWYEKAAKGGHPLALRKIEERAEVRAAAEVAHVATTEEKKPAPPDRLKERPAPKARPTKAVAPPKPREPATHVVARTEKRAAEPAPAKVAEPVTTKPPEAPMIVAKAAVSEPPPPSFNVAQILLGGKWSLNQRAAEILPSAFVACLPSGAAEIVCFSQELTGNVGDSGLTYTVKAVLNGFNNRDGRFNLRYVYNVSDVDYRPIAEPSGAPDGDLAPRRGWHEPGFKMECRLDNERSLSCTRDDRKIGYRFIRN